MKTRKIFQKKNLGLLLVFLFSLIICCASYLHFLSLGKVLDSQEVAQRWQGESKQTFTQVSCFFPQDELLEKAEVESFRETVNQRIGENSLDIKENIPSWIDAYSGQTRLPVKSPYAQIETSVMGVGGNYFFFHPLQLRSGSYISESDLAHNKAILDEALAWKLFGSVEVVGLEVQIDHKVYFISGVVRGADDPYNERADTEKYGRIYLSYQALARLTDTGISCYEAVVPEPVPGFTTTLVRDGFSAPAKEVLQNSGRFGLPRIFFLWMDSEELVMHRKGIAYPPWENAARLLSYRLSQWLIAIFLGAAFSLIIFLLLFCSYWPRMLEGLNKCQAYIKSIEGKIVLQRIVRRCKNGRYYLKTFKKGLRWKCYSRK